MGVGAQILIFHRAYRLHRSRPDTRFSSLCPSTQTLGKLPLEPDVTSWSRLPNVGLTRKAVIMKFNILDTESIYRRLLNEPDAAQREAIFRQELIAPFAGLIQVFGGGDELAMFGQWGMRLDLFDGERREKMQA